MHPAFSFALSATAYVLLLVVVYKGRLRRSAFFIPVLCASFGLVLGGLFKLQHWSGANELLVSSGALLVVCYAIRFTRKTRRQRLDWLKLGYVVALGTRYTLIGFGWRPLLPWVQAVAFALLWAVILDFVYVTYIRRPTQPPTA